MSSSLAGRAKPPFSPSPDLSALLGVASMGDAPSEILASVGPAEVVPGWATVEIEHHIGSVLRAGATERDDLLGAAAAVVTVAGGRRVALLEPTTEGPLAAALARHGEGWVAAYLVSREPSVERHLRRAGFRLSRTGRGPLGLERRVLVGRRDGPFILVVGGPALGGPLVGQ